MRLSKYTKNLNLNGNKVISFGRTVAVIRNKKVTELGYWNYHIRKHVKYVAKELNMEYVPNNSKKSMFIKYDADLKKQKLGRMRNFCDLVHFEGVSDKLELLKSMPNTLDLDKLSNRSNRYMLREVNFIFKEMKRL